MKVNLIREKTPLIRFVRMLAIVMTVLIAGLASPPPAAAVDESPGHLWPLDIDPAVSSNFGEYREGHFHAGLDLRTYGREGIACLAVADGHVSRIRAAPGGYGKAVYVQLVSGQTAVYAHLSEFSPALEEALYQEQTKKGRYEVDFRFEPGRFAVRRGDVVAYSGSTGAKAPHLHFEIRDPGENPLNPFSHGFALDDRAAPVVTRAFLAPLDTDARINHRCYPVELTALKTGPNTFVIPETLCVEGAVGVGAEIFDRLNPASGKLAPYNLALSVDGTNVCDIQLERFSFGHTSQVDFIYDITRVRMDKDYFFTLFERSGESLWNRLFLAGGRIGNVLGGGATAPGDEAVHVAVLSATDRSGNSCDLTIYLHGPEGGSRVRDSAGRDFESGFGVLPGFYFFEDMMSIRLEPAGKSRLPFDRLAVQGVTCRSGGADAGFAAYGEDQFLEGPVTVPYYDEGSVNFVHLCGFEKGIARSVDIPSLGLQLFIRGQTLYTDAILYVAGWDGATENGELTRKSHLARIGPYSATLSGDFEVTFLVGRPDSSMAVYRLNEQESKWVYYASSFGEGVVSTTARRPGLYAVMSDKHAPRIRVPYVRTHTSYATGRQLPEIVVPIEEGGSGLDADRTAVYLAGFPQIVRWDENEKKLFVLVRDQNIMNVQALSVAAYDQTGNRSQLDTTIVLRQSAQQGNE